MHTIKLIQISDCHLPESPDTPYRGELVWQQLQDIVERAREWSPAAIVVSGDISEQAGASSYQFIQKTLGSLSLPVYCQTGNHDKPEVMEAVLSAPLSMPTSVVKDPQGLACRWLELSENGQLETGLLYSAR